MTSEGTPVGWTNADKSITKKDIKTGLAKQGKIIKRELSNHILFRNKSDSDLLPATKYELVIDNPTGLDYSVFFTKDNQNNNILLKWFEIDGVATTAPQNRWHRLCKSKQNCGF